MYRGIREKFDGLKPLGRARMPAKVWRLEPEPNLTVLFIDEPEWFDRDGLYGHADDAERFIFFSKCVARLARRAITQWNDLPGNDTDATGDAILIDPDRQLMETAIQALLKNRDNRPVSIKE